MQCTSVHLNIKKHYCILHTSFESFTFTVSAHPTTMLFNLFCVSGHYSAHTHWPLTQRHAIVLNLNLWTLDSWLFWLFDKKKQINILTTRVLKKCNACRLPTKRRSQSTVTLRCSTRRRFVQGEADTPTVLTEQESIISCCLRLATPTIARLAALHPTHAAYVAVVF